MRTGQLGDDKPEIPVSMTIKGSLNRLLDLTDPLNQEVCLGIGRGLTQLLEVLGIPGVPVVSLGPLAEDGKTLGQFFRISVGGQICLYEDQLLQRIYSYVNGELLSWEPKPAQIMKWLGEISNNLSRGGGTSRQRLVEFLSQACLEVVKKQPAVLLGPAQIAAYQASLDGLAEDTELPLGIWPPAMNVLLQILHRVINLRISIADKEKVSKVLKEGLNNTQAPEDIAENLVEALRPHVLEVQLPQDYFQEIQSVSSGSGAMFAPMQDGMYDEFGLRYPRIHLAQAEYLKPGSFAFKINHMTTLPRVGLAPHQCLVNGAPALLQEHGISARSAVNPADWGEFSLVDMKFQSEVRAAGFYSWDQMGYMILAFGADLREHSECFLDCQVVKKQLDQLDRYFPALVQACETRITVEELTRVLRLLVREEISIRNLKLILELLVSSDYIVSDPSKLIIFDDRIPLSQEPEEGWRAQVEDLASFVRSGMKRYISYKYWRGQALVVFILDYEIERMMAEHQVRVSARDEILGEADLDNLLTAVRTEVNEISPPLPPILTTTNVRPILRELLAPNFPRLPVIAYNEISPEVNIQPIARISLAKA